MDEDLYKRLKRELPARGISSFISAAVRAQLRPGPDELEAAYRRASEAASHNAEEHHLAEDWGALDTAEWPEE